MSLYPRACPKCNGTLERDRQYADEILCINCGYRTYRTPPLPLVRERNGFSGKEGGRYRSRELL